MKKPEITGQLIIREAGKKNGKRLVIVCGIIAVPEDAPITGETQYVTSGNVEDGRLGLVLHTGSGNDLASDLKGMLPSQWLTSPIWKV